MEKIEIDEIKKVVFRKGDILILRYGNILPEIARKYLVESCEMVLDRVGLRDQVGIMILEQGLDISVLTQADIDEVKK